jgi:hypothetical protein
MLPHRNKKWGPGRVIESLSQEEREALQNLSSDQVSSEDMNAKLFADESYQQSHKNELIIKSEKLKFDKLIIKR